MNQLGDSNAKRQFEIYNSTHESTDKDITSKFFSETGFGIAKTELQGVGPFGWRGKVEVAMDAKVQECLRNAYSKLHPKGKFEDALKLTDGDRLPELLRIISVALDEVINERCNDEVK